jgi:Tfp pilus assembly protein PilF
MDAIRLDPNNSSPHYLLGRVYTRMGKSELAAEQFKITENLIHQQNSKSGGMASRH